MKPWLLNILACPIDKHHPLEARFFTWETSKDEIKKAVIASGTPSSKFKKSYGQLAKQLKDGTISPTAIQAIEDLTNSNESKELLALAIEAMNRLEKSLDKPEKELLQSYSEDIDRLHRFLNLLEVDVGLLVCSECGRWYPVGSSVETIPELLPDDLRDRERDIAWLERWRELIPQPVLEYGKPFNLNG